MAAEQKALSIDNLKEAMLQNNQKIKEYADTADTALRKDLNIFSKHQKYLNTELDSCHCILSSSYTTVLDEYVPFVKKNGNMTVENGLITVKSGSRIQISLVIGFYDAESTTYENVRFKIKNNTTGEILSTVHSVQDTTIIHYPLTCECQYENTSLSDEQIGIYIDRVTVADTLNQVITTLTVHEIGRQITIDPVEYIDKTNGLEDTPVGHIISHMGTVAPKHYLICDGTEYNILDYPYLANHILDNFGSYNFFGGDGEITFAVPDLRGEFLRGTGTAERDTGSGADVGEHQDATSLPMIYQYNDDNPKITLRGDDGTLTADNAYAYTNTDKNVPVNGNVFGLKIEATSFSSGMKYASQTSRPTNTSVLYCIKYEPTYYMDTHNTNYMQPSMYSEEERIIGCWINGKPLYEKTIKTIVPADGTVDTRLKLVDTTELNIEHCIYLDGCIIDTYWIVNLNNKSNQAWYRPQANEIAFITINEVYIGKEIVITIQYTKTIDEENSFTTDMITDYIVKIDGSGNGNTGGDNNITSSETYTDEEVDSAIDAILQDNTEATE